MKFGGICITTNNTLKLVEFYKIIFDMEPVKESDHYSFASVAIYDPKDTNLKEDKSIWLQCFSEDVDKEYKRLLDAIPDLDVISPPTRRPWGAYSFWIVDPDGNKIAVAEVG